MDIAAIFEDAPVATVRVYPPPVEQDDEPAADDATLPGWSEWTEHRDGRTWRIMQADGEYVVPWEHGIAWEHDQ